MKFRLLLFGLSTAALLTNCARRPTKLKIYDVVINHVTLVDVRNRAASRPNQVVAIAQGQNRADCRWPTRTATPPSST